MRMRYDYDLSAPKKPTNLTVNSDLLAQAKALGINLSQVLEQSLTQEVKKRKPRHGSEKIRRPSKATTRMSLILVSFPTTCALSDAT